MMRMEDGVIPKLEKIWSLERGERTSCSKCTKNPPEILLLLCKKYKMKKIKIFLEKSIDNGLKSAIIINARTPQALPTLNFRNELKN